MQHGDDACDSALDDAWVAAREAAGDAAWIAVAQDASWSAAWVSARASAGYAAGAAAVRDIISDWHYATIAGPWESVMGPIFKSN